MRIHLHTFATNPEASEWDPTYELLRNVRQSFWDFYARWGTSQPPIPLPQAQALHSVSSDSNTFVLTETYALSGFHGVMKNLHRLPMDVHEVFIGGDAGLAEIATYIPRKNVYINWVGTDRPKHWRSLPVHRWITSNQYLTSKPTATPFFNNVQHIAMTCSPVADNFTSSLPQSESPSLASQNMLLFMLAETNRPNGLPCEHIHNTALSILEKLAYDHVSIASLDSKVSKNTLHYISMDTSGITLSSDGSSSSMMNSPNGLFAHSSAMISTHPNTFDTFIRNARCSLIFSVVSLDCLSKVVSVSSIIEHRHRIFAVIPQGLTKKVRGYMYALHQQGYFNIVDFNQPSNPVSLLADDAEYPLVKSISKELFDTLRRHGIAYPKLSYGVSACSMYNKMRQSNYKIAPAVESRTPKKL